MMFAENYSDNHVGVDEEGESGGPKTDWKTFAAVEGKPTGETKCKHYTGF